MAAGHHIYALEEGSIPAKGQGLVRTGIAIGLPKGPMADWRQEVEWQAKMG